MIFTDSDYLMRNIALKVLAHGLYPNLSNFEGVFLETMFLHFVGRIEKIYGTDQADISTD